MIELRPKQSALVDEIRQTFRESQSVLLVSPTGSGKTVMFAYITQRASALGRRVLIVAHRVELLEQISRALRLFNVAHGMIAPGCERTNHPVQVASVFTLARRLDSIAVPDLIIVDEAHHAVASTWARMLDKFANARVLGVTATPERMDGKGLGADVGGYFQRMIVGPDVAELIGDGHLAQPKIYASPRHLSFDDVRVRAGDFATDQVSRIMSRPEIVGDAIDHYRRLIDGKRAIAFCASVAHAEALGHAFSEAGIPASSIDGTMATAERSQIVRDFSAGRIKLLTSCDLISEGFDVPALDAVMLMRPTKSLAIYLQQVGRCLRPCEGKDFAFILDHVGNVARHGLPHEFRAWSLDGRSDGRQERAPSTIECPQCFAIWPIGTETCADCEHSFEEARMREEQERRERQARALEQVDGDLAEVTPEMIAARRAQRQLELRQARTREELEQIAQRRGYRRGWVDHILNARARQEQRA